MTIVTIIVLVIAAVLTGMKTAYGIDWYKGKEKPFYQVWLNKNLYPAVMIWLAAYFIFWYAAGHSLTMVRLMDMIASYLVLSVVDAKRKLVPDPILACFLAGQMLLGILAMDITDLWHLIWTGTVFGVVVLVSALISKDKVGMGDVLLLWVTAMTAGWTYTLMILTIGIFLSFVFGMGLLLFRRGTLKTEVPFVPFLAAGILVHTVIFVL